MYPLVSFRPLERRDFPTLRAWLSTPHVAIWWNEPADVAAVETKYGPRVDGLEPTHVFFIHSGGEPIGWIQWYSWADYPIHAKQLRAEPCAAGVDLAIGRLDRIGIGLGPLVIRAFLSGVVFSEPSVCAVVSDPQEANVRSVRAFEKAGFKATETLRLANESARRTIVRMERPTPGADFVELAVAARTASV
jgi:aminoglycoside 6'-N-acetyltransferase